MAFGMKSADEAYDAWSQILMQGFVPDVMIIAHPEGTWLLVKDQEPRLLGEEKDFEGIMLDALHGNLRGEQHG